MKKIFYNIFAAFLIFTPIDSWTADLVLNEISLNQLPIAKGERVSLFYVNGREPTIGAVGHRLQVERIVSTPVVAVVDNKRSVTFPEVSIPRRAGFVNYLLFVIHNKGQLEVSVRNADGKWIPDERNITVPVEGARYGDVSLIKLYNLRPNANVPIVMSAKDVFGEM